MLPAIFTLPLILSGECFYAVLAKESTAFGRFVTPPQGDALFSSVIIVELNTP